jgi:hypothetical protein
VARAKHPRHSQKVATLYGAIRNQQAYGVNLRWLSNSELGIQYLKAKQARIVNSSPAIGAKELQIILQSGIADPSAPPGGMLYNLRKHTDASNGG